MRIIIDMQGAQAENKNRGIGRCAISFVKALIRNRGEHEILLALNGDFYESVCEIRNEFEKMLPPTCICVWMPPKLTQLTSPANKIENIASEMVYEYFLASYEPDFIYIPSLFEGLVDGAVTSVHAHQHTVPVAVTLHDIIPYLYPIPYLENIAVKSWYMNKIENLKRADLFFAVSESSRREGVAHLGLPDKFSIATPNDADAIFESIDISGEKEKILREKYGLVKKFVMYTGGIDYRKNVEGLIRAYAKLPAHVRNNHQLAIVCLIHPKSRHDLEKIILDSGLKFTDVVITGYIPDDDLLALYNLCHLFVFPSLHEGFGLPALEAMRCGAPVIGANTSSLPEVIGWDKALFDPRSEESIAQVMLTGLTDEVFRSALIRHCLDYAKNFSWDESARRALLAMEGWEQFETPKKVAAVLKSKGRKLAYISPLPPARTGIAGYSAELLLELTKYYEVDVIVDQKDAVTDSWILENTPVRNSEWFIENANRYERIIYHFGNSSYHQHMFGLLEKFPGVVVLHDFFLSGVQAHRDNLGLAPNVWAQSLYASHGYCAVKERYTAKDDSEIIWRYPTNLSVLQRALDVIVHSKHSRKLAQHWYAGRAGADWPVIPLLRARPKERDRDAARKALGLAHDDFIVCSFGMLGPSKLNHRLLQAWLNSPLAIEFNNHLIFVGENNEGDYGRSLIDTIRSSGVAQQIKITGWISTDIFEKYLSAADIAVQLRTLSRGETSAAVLDCMNYGLPTIVNANGSMTNLDPHGVWMIQDEFEDEELVTALTTLAKNPRQRASISIRAAEIVRVEHAPEECAKRYYEAIERIYQKAEVGLLGLTESLMSVDFPKTEHATLAQNLADNFPLGLRRRQLFVDISELVQRDAKTGIQRVVRAILCEWLTNPPAGYQVEPVYATTDSLGYRYARRFTCQFLGIPQEWMIDEPVDSSVGDIFVGLDLQPNVIYCQEQYLKRLRVRGVKLWFIVYDLLPILLPKCFPPEGEELHTRWLHVVSGFDGLVCISQSVANELQEWLVLNRKNHQRQPVLKWFHLGADIFSGLPSLGMRPEQLKILHEIRERPSFIMVGTIEPRKGHEVILSAFEELWKSDVNCNILIVGKQGWMVESLVNRLRFHPESGKRLFWFESCSDEFLNSLYSASSCLIASSYGEGFGLPLVEATQHGLPIIARDIPVFREIAHDNVHFFQSDNPKDIAINIENWLNQDFRKQKFLPGHASFLTWSKSAQNLSRLIVENI